MQGDQLINKKEIRKRGQNIFRFIKMRGIPKKQWNLTLSDTTDTEVTNPIQEIEIIFRKFKYHKACGKDHIVAELIKNGRPVLKNELHQFITKI